MGLAPVPHSPGTSKVTTPCKNLPARRHPTAATRSPSAWSCPPTTGRMPWTWCLPGSRSRIIPTTRSSWRMTAPAKPPRRWCAGTLSAGAAPCTIYGSRMRGFARRRFTTRPSSRPQAGTSSFLTAIAFRAPAGCRATPRWRKGKGSSPAPKSSSPRPSPQTRWQGASLCTA